VWPQSAGDEARALAAGFLLPVDAEGLIKAADASRVLR
jgi:hypothetical protein